jgi:hypothetical protein
MKTRYIQYRDGPVEQRGFGRTEPSSRIGRLTEPSILGDISRRRFIGTAAGAILVAGLPLPTWAAGSGPGNPIPIPHVFTGTPFGSFHFFFPGPVEGTATPIDPTGVHPGRDPSTIFDFNGFIGQADLDLSGVGTDTTTGATAPYTFHTDMRFMKGEFVGTDGQNHRGAFAFI